MMNHLDIAVVHEIIELARLCYPIDGRSQVVSTFRIDVDDNPETIALYQKVASLSPEELAELRALMLLGRHPNDQTSDDWDDLYTDSLAAQLQASVDYVASKYQLAQYLQNGLTVLNL
ncbi:DUF3775 domain-containing protein [Vibrio cyclitrophicus]